MKEKLNRIMKKQILFIVIMILATISVNSAELSMDLQDRINNSSADEKIEVWIKLPEVQSASQLKSALKVSTSTHATRYRSGVARLKTSHLIAQKQILSELRDLKKRGKVSRIKTHWLINVIEAEITKDQLEILSNNSAIEKIILPHKATFIEPTKSYSASTQDVGVGDNIKYMNADGAWQMGYTGNGRVVCNFDTGVEGTHPALFSNWKGHDGDSAAAWFDGRYGEPFPHSFSSDDGTNPGTFDVNHGSHTMGTMVGHDDVLGDTIGVAPGAKWISAGVLDIQGTSLIDAFEWAANPDGDLNSVGDIPDVINHSWGVPEVECADIFYRLSDNLEALGIVNIFAAGNEGGIASIRNPANRALDSIDCFAIGSISITVVDTPKVENSSSRGPSDCNGAFKPNVVAPGSIIRSALIDGNYGIKGGTSMAAPHVSGMVPLLREKNPNATVDEIKTAILVSARDFGNVLPDNNFGWGVVDCVGALNALSGTNNLPNVRVYKYDHNPVIAGDTISGTVVLQNLGSSVDLVTLIPGTVDPSLTLLSGSISFGNFNEGDTIRSSDSLKVVIADTVTEGTILSLDMEISGTGYSQATTIYFQVEPNLERSILTHNTGAIQISVSNYGLFGFGDDSFYPATGGAGFKFEGGLNDLWLGGVMVSAEGNYVSDAVHNFICDPDSDFNILPGGNIEMAGSPEVADEETSSLFSDQRAEQPIGLTITQSTYAYTTPPNQNFVILKYKIHNPTAQTISDVNFGLYFDWDIINYANNCGGYNFAGQYLWMAHKDTDTTNSSYRGMVLLNGNLSSAQTQSVFVTGCDIDGFTEAEKIKSLTDGTRSASTYVNARDDLNQTMAVGPIILGADDSYTFVFAVIAGIDSTEFAESVLAARTAYQNSSILTDVEEDELIEILPKTIELAQNYPNPFNPVTTIAYSLPERSAVSISVFNILGQEVRQLINKTQSAGNYKIEWDGRDDTGSSVSSGVYLYRIIAGEFRVSKKMLLLK